jgi:site-specific DNA recombinase
MTGSDHVSGNVDLMHHKLVGYCRVSTAIQVNDGCSLEAQAAKITQWASAQGHTIVGMFSDAGVTGTRADRPGFQAALDAACANKCLLTVTSLSRAARSTRNAMDLVARLEQAGAGFCSLGESLETSSAHGRFLFKMLASLAEMEAEIVAERTVAAMAHLRAQGRRVSGKLPFGWDAVGDGMLLPNEREQAVLAAMREHRAAGAAWCAIAAWLTAEGIATKCGRTWRGDAVRAIVQRAERLEKERAA